MVRSVLFEESNQSRNCAIRVRVMYNEWRKTAVRSLPAEGADTGNRLFVRSYNGKKFNKFWGLID